MGSRGHASRWLGNGRLAAVVAVVTLGLCASAGTPDVPAVGNANRKSSHFDLDQLIVAKVLERFANNPKTSAREVRELLQYDLDAGLWVVCNRSFRSNDLLECAKYLVRLHKLEDSQAVRIAEVYSLWEGMHPEAFDMATHDPVRNHVLTRMLAEARGQGAKKKIQQLIDRFAGERAMFQKPTDIPRKYELDP